MLLSYSFHGINEGLYFYYHFHHGHLFLVYSFIYLLFNIWLHHVIHRESQLDSSQWTGISGDRRR